ncbi:hypothetical protein ATCC90586_003987 [Pythium insidiosum]|nr:hypothetical protein ATCC90586_003987 [Pythium insidiosum]
MKLLLRVLRRFYGTPLTRRLERAELPPDASSCAVLALSLVALDDEAEAAAALGELLRVVDLLRHPALGAEALHVLLDRKGGRCPLVGWCAFCDGGSRELTLRLDWGGGLPALETAMFAWTDAMASRDFARLLKAANDAMAKRSDGGLARRVAPIELSLCVRGDEWARGDELCRRLQAQLDRDAAPPRFRVSFRPREDLDAKELALQGPPSAAVRVGETTSNWDWVLAPRSVADGAAASHWDARAAVLATGKIVSLRARVETHEQAQRLHEVLRSQPTALRSLSVEYDNFFSAQGRSIADDARQQQFQDVADALLASDSALRLEELTLTGKITQRDLLAMLTRLRSASTASSSTHRRLHKLTCAQWDWAEMRGATVAELLRAIGGVDSLRLQRKNSLRYISTVPIDELPDLVHGCASLRQLDAHVVCSKPLLIPQPRDSPVARVHVSSLDDMDLPSDQPAETTALERLRLRPVDGDVALVQRSVERLLQRVGRRLVALTLAPHRGHAALGGQSGAAVARLCPTLQELKVTCLDASFVAELVDALAAGDGSCPLQRLDLGSHDADASTFAPLFAALRVSTHPLTRSLRSLRLDVADVTRVEPLISSVQDLLVSNQRLQDVTVCAESVDASTVKEQLEASGVLEATSALVLPPLRHRLAVLSALRPRHLPRNVAANVLELVARRVPRLRLDETELQSPMDDVDQE